MGLVKGGRIVEVDGVQYSVKKRAKYVDAYRYCSRCCEWIRRVDLREIERCPFCNTMLRYSVGGKEKRYISVDDVYDG